MYYMERLQVREWQKTDVSCQTPGGGGGRRAGGRTRGGEQITNRAMKVHNRERVQVRNCSFQIL
jgi:hypothetical protein